jgi:hypothetical protein
MEAGGLKRYLVILICLGLCLLAVGCAGTGGEPAREAEDAADHTPEPAFVDDVPTLPPEEQIVQTLQPADFAYSILESADGNLSLEYPSHWLRIPGARTICYSDAGDDGSIPARFTLTRKTLADAPNAERKSSQLASFLRAVVEGYDSVEVSDLSTDGDFMSDPGAYYATYTATKGDDAVKGYAILTAREKSLYVYHFRAPFAEYDAFSPVMKRIRDSVSMK